MTSLKSAPYSRNKSMQNSSIGENCKIHGEVSHSIIESFSNKAHHGFLGHSYVGNWCNLGAGTTTSNLKNNYSNVTVINGKNKTNTQTQFLGTIFGDFVKTAIGTQLNSGSILSIGTSLFNHNFKEKFYPPFSWGYNEKQTAYDIDKFINTTEIIMNRRNIKLSKAHEELFTLLHKSYCK